MENLIVTELEDNVLIAKINRPNKLNALNRTVIGELGEIVNRVRGDNDIKGLIITGEGDKAFAAGADISEFQNYPKEEAILMAEKGHKVFERIETCPKPVIAAVNGFCLGGGCELALSAHMRVASEDAKFGLPEISLGIHPGYGGTQRLPMLIGKSKAMELILTGDMLTATEAHQLGLVNHVTSQEELLPKCREILSKISSKGALAIAEIIKLVNASGNTDRSGFEQEIESFGNSFETQDFKEGVDAFLNKRKPEFVGK